MKIISTTYAQRHIGDISDSVADFQYIVTKGGAGKVVMLPYFDGCDENIREYTEDYEMYKNAPKLIQQFKESHESGHSDLVI